MRKILFLLAVASTSLLFPVKALATQWVRVISTDEVVVHIDVDSIKVDGNQRRFWQRDTFPGGRQFSGQYINALSLLYSINCSSKILRSFRGIGYDETGSVVFDFDSRLHPFSNSSSNEIIPGTLGDSVVELVCNRETANSNSGESSFSNLSNQQAINLINRWLKEKGQIFSPPFNQSILSGLTTGKLYSDSMNSIAWLRNNNARYQYGLQQIESVESFSSTGNQAFLEVRVSEDATLFVNGRVEPKASGFKTRTIKYNLQLVDGVWKIEDY